MDIELYFNETGAGEPLILLHGNNEDGSYFKHQVAHFSPLFRVIALDTRGHGKSPRGTAPFTLRQFADDLLNFMDAHGLGRAHLLGFSDGGNIALLFALAYPDRVNRLVLNGANLDIIGIEPVLRQAIISKHQTTLKRVQESERMLRKAEMLGLMVNDPNIHPSELAGLDIPTLVIAGTNDMIEEQHTRLIYDNLPNAKLALIPGDHFIAANSPEAFNHEVELFLRS